MTAVDLVRTFQPRKQPLVMALDAVNLSVDQGEVHLLNGNMAGAGGQALLEAAVGACWLGICLLTFRWFVYRGRRSGSLEYAT